MAAATLTAKISWLGINPESFHIRSFSIPYGALALLTVPTWIVMLALAGAYDLGPVRHQPARSWVQVVRAGAQLLAVVAVAYYILHLEMLGRGVLVGPRAAGRGAHPRAHGLARARPRPAPPARSCAAHRPRRRAATQRRRVRRTRSSRRPAAGVAIVGRRCWRPCGPRRARPTRRRLHRRTATGPRPRRRRANGSPASRATATVGARPVASSRPPTAPTRPATQPLARALARTGAEAVDHRRRARAGRAARHRLDARGHGHRPARHAGPGRPAGAAASVMRPVAGLPLLPPRPLTPVSDGQAAGSRVRRGRLSPCGGGSRTRPPPAAAAPARGGAGGGRRRRLGRLPAQRRPARPRRRRDLGLELEDPLHAVEVEALVGELLDATELGDVGVAVAAAAAARCGPGRPGPCARRCAGSAGGRRPARRPPRSRRPPASRHGRRVASLIILPRTPEVLPG